jgi:hypothetical protein
MKNQFSISKVLFAAALLNMTYFTHAETELEKLKREASKSIATLKIKENKGTKKDLEYIRKIFYVNTGVKKYVLRYSSFLGENAKNNPKMLNDQNSGYGMVNPAIGWYSNGFIRVALRGKSGNVYMHNLQGKIIALQTEGDRVGYDIVFKNNGGTIVVRTIALAGKYPLFVAVYGKLSKPGAANMNTKFRAYPSGFKKPFNRCVLGENLKVGHSEKKSINTKVESDKTSWLLLTDIGKPGCVGLVFDKKDTGSININHNGNYAVCPFFYKTGNDSIKQQFIVYNFGKLAHSKATAELKNTVVESEKLFNQAFDGLIDPFATDR